MLLWRGLTATAPIPPLVQELPYATGKTLLKKKSFQILVVVLNINKTILVLNKLLCRQEHMNMLREFSIQQIPLFYSQQINISVDYVD